MYCSSIWLCAHVPFLPSVCSVGPAGQPQGVTAAVWAQWLAAQVQGKPQAVRYEELHGRPIINNCFLPTCAAKERGIVPTALRGDSVWCTLSAHVTVCSWVLLPHWVSQIHVKQSGCCSTEHVRIWAVFSLYEASISSFCWCCLLVSPPAVSNASNVNGGSGAPPSPTASENLDKQPTSPTGA
jgi:hypothetical protein